MSYQTLTKYEGLGQHGIIGVHILVDAPESVNLMGDKLRDAAYTARELIEQELTAAMIAADPDAIAHSNRERRELLGLFPEPIHVEEIPNGYCSRACCRHLPWFVVTTRIGRITIGWRKRVISIDWSGTRETRTSGELFPEGDVTKADRLIHAWSLDQARRYIATIIDSEPREEMGTR